MKIDLDLSEIFADGEKNLNQSVKEAIIDGVIERISDQIQNDAANRLNDYLERGITAKIKETLDSLMPEILNYEFVETGHYGRAEKPITVKNRILKDIEREMAWKDGTWESDKSIYTKLLKKVVEEWMNKFKPEFDKLVNAQFTAEAMEYAQKKMSEKLGLKK